MSYFQTKLVCFQLAPIDFISASFIYFHFFSVFNVFPNEFKFIHNQAILKSTIMCTDEHFQCSTMRYFLHPEMIFSASFLFFHFFFFFLFKYGHQMIFEYSIDNLISTTDRGKIITLLALVIQFIQQKFCSWF